MTLFPEQNVKTAEANGIPLAYQEIGSGYPLVLINGFASPMDTWNPPVLAALARTFRVIIFDNRGTGFSGASEESFSIRVFAQDTAALMEHLGIRNAHVLGLSMGASIAQELILAHPETVDRLILVAGTCGGDRGIQCPPEIWAKLSDKSGSIPEIVDRMFSVLFPQEWRATHDPMNYCPVVHETTTEDNAARQAGAFFSWGGSWERLPAIRNRVLVVTGTDDCIIPPENSRILASRIQGARICEIPGAGHGLQYQCPGEFAERIIEFLLAE